MSIWRDRLRRLRASRFVRDTIWLQFSKFGSVGSSLASSVIVWRLLGPERYGVYGLALSFLTLVHTLDLSGLTTSTVSRLAVALGARDDEEARDLIAFHLGWIIVIHGALAALIALIGRPMAHWLHGDARISELALALTGALLLDGLYGLIVTTLQARRSMRTVAALSLVNQVVLSGALVIAAAIDPRAEALVLARYVYGALTLVLAIAVYAYQSGRVDPPLPRFGAVFARLGRVAGGRYWRFGIANAIDKNIGEWFVQVPIQLVGAIGGSTAAGFLTLALTGIANIGILTSAIFDNLRTVIPQVVGRGDYPALWRGTRAALIGLAGAGGGVYGVAAIGAVLIVPSLLGAEWQGAVPALLALTLYGWVTTVAGVFGPIYRALGLMRAAIRAKLIALVLVLLPGAIALAIWDDPSASAVSIAGALLIGVIFLVQGLLTARAVVPVVRRLANSALTKGT